MVDERQSSGDQERAIQKSDRLHHCESDRQASVSQRLVSKGPRRKKARRSLAPLTSQVAPHNLCRDSLRIEPRVCSRFQRLAGLAVQFRPFHQSIHRQRR